MRLIIAPIVAIGLIGLLGQPARAAFTIELVTTINPQPDGSYLVAPNDSITFDIVLKSDSSTDPRIQGTEFYLQVQRINGAEDDGLLFTNLSAEPYTSNKYIFFGNSTKQNNGEPVAVTLTGALDSSGNPVPSGGPDNFFGGGDEFAGSGGVPVSSTGVLIGRLVLQAGTNVGSRYRIDFTDLASGSDLRESRLIRPPGEGGDITAPFDNVSAEVTIIQGDGNVVPAPPGVLLALIGVPFAGLLARRRARTVTA